MRTEMFKSALNALNCYGSRALSTKVVSSSKRKVTILGSADGIGEDLAVLMKSNPRVETLSLFNFGGSADYVERIATRAQIKRYDGYDGYEKALEKSDVVIITTGVPKKFDDTFAINASIVRDHCEAISKYSSKALVNIICNQVNSTVPVAAKVFQNAGTYDPKKLFGVTSLDGFRAKTLYALKAGIDDKGVFVPVVGGHAGITVLPLFSQATPQANLSKEDIKFLTSRVRYGGTEVIANGKSSAISSRAFAGAMFADACLKGLNGVSDVVQCSYVQSEVTELPFFTSKVRLGMNGVEEVMGLGSLSDDERASLENLLPELKQSINKGTEFVNIA